MRTYKRALDINNIHEMQERLQRAEAALKQSKQKNYYKILGESIIFFERVIVQVSIRTTLHILIRNLNRGR